MKRIEVTCHEESLPDGDGVVVLSGKEEGEVEAEVARQEAEEENLMVGTDETTEDHRLPGMVPSDTTEGPGVKLNQGMAIESLEEGEGTMMIG